MIVANLKRALMRRSLTTNKPVEKEDSNLKGLRVSLKYFLSNVRIFRIEVCGSDHMTPSKKGEI